MLVGLIPVLVLGSLVVSYLGAAALGHTGAEVVLGLILGLIAGFTTAVAIVAVIYKLFPRAAPSWREALFGALIAAGCIAGLSAAYDAHLRLGANFEHRYASDALASPVLLGLWMFAANCALLIGYQAARRRRRDSACAAPGHRAISLLSPNVEDRPPQLRNTT